MSVEHSKTTKWGDKFAPEGFKPKVYVPAFLFEDRVRVPKRKTVLMGRVEYNTDTPIIPLFRYWREELGMTYLQIAQAAGIGAETASTWAKNFGIISRAKRNTHAA